MTDETTPALHLRFSTDVSNRKEKTYWRPRAPRQGRCPVVPCFPPWPLELVLVGLGEYRLPSIEAYECSKSIERANDLPIKVCVLSSPAEILFVCKRQKAMSTKAYIPC
jgi:hypothetical protein